MVGLPMSNRTASAARAGRIRAWWQAGFTMRFLLEVFLTVWTFHVAPLPVAISIGLLFVLVEGIALTLGDLLKHLRAGDEI